MPGRKTKLGDCLCKPRINEKRGGVRRAVQQVPPILIPRYVHCPHLPHAAIASCPPATARLGEPTAVRRVNRACDDVARKDVEAGPRSLFVQLHEDVPLPRGVGGFLALGSQLEVVPVSRRLRLYRDSGTRPELLRKHICTWRVFDRYRRQPTPERELGRDEVFPGRTGQPRLCNRAVREDASCFLRRKCVLRGVDWPIVSRRFETLLRPCDTPETLARPSRKGLERTSAVPSGATRSSLRNERFAATSAGIGSTKASGACRDRTGDLRLAKPALSQLS